MLMLFFQDKIWFQDSFEYAELDGDVDFLCFTSELPFLDKFRTNFKIDFSGEIW